MLKQLFCLAFCSLSLFGEEEIAFEDPPPMDEMECPNGHSCRRYRLPCYNAEEEKFYEDRTEAHWPGKREDTLLEKLTHY